MKRVNVVVKAVIFCVLFGGMVLGVTTRANANPAGCTGSGHASCEYDTIQSCYDANNLLCAAGLDKVYTGHFYDACLNCDPNKDCHSIDGTWTEAECVVTCFNKEGQISGTGTFSVSRVVWDHIGGKCN